MADGNDTIEGGTGDDTVYAGAGDDLILPGDNDDGDDVLNGGSGRDTIDGGDGNDTIGAADQADDAADSLMGGEGDDRIVLGAGDFADGGEDRDDYLVHTSYPDSTIAYSPEDRVVIQYEGPAEAPPRIELVQDGDNVRVMADGDLVTTLRDTLVRDVSYQVQAQPAAESTATGA